MNISKRQISLIGSIVIAAWTAGQSASANVVLVTGLPANICEGEQTLFQIELQNRSDKSISVESITPSCGCVICPDKEVGIRLINPKGLLKVPVQLETQNKVGPLTHSLIIKWKNANGSLNMDTVPLVANVERNIEIIPSLMEDEKVFQGENKVCLVDFKMNKVAGPLKCYLMGSQSPVKLLKLGGQENCYQAGIPLKSSTVGEFSDTLIIKDQKFAYRYPLIWTVHGPNFEEDALSLGLTKQGDSKIAELHVLHPQDFTVVEVTSSLARKVEWQTVEDGPRKKDLKIAFNDINLPQGQFSGSACIVIKEKGSRKFEKLDIPIYALLY